MGTQTSYPKERSVAFVARISFHVFPTVPALTQRLVQAHVKVVSVFITL